MDCLLNFSLIAKQHQYVRPTLAEEAVIDIKEGRHPVIERLMPAEEDYIPNDVFLDQESQQIMIITGPRLIPVPLRTLLLLMTCCDIVAARLRCSTASAARGC